MSISSRSCDVKELVENLEKPCAEAAGHVPEHVCRIEALGLHEIAELRGLLVLAVSLRRLARPLGLDSPSDWRVWMFDWFIPFRRFIISSLVRPVKEVRSASREHVRDPRGSSGGSRSRSDSPGVFRKVPMTPTSSSSRTRHLRPRIFSSWPARASPTSLQRPPIELWVLFIQE